MSPVHERILFGLKVRQFRNSLELSFAALSDLSGLSVSYLNEIEKGKKYPKPEKARALAKALGVSVVELTSLQLEGNLAPVGDLLQSNFLEELPLEFFGIEPAKVIELIAQAPKEVGAFISTLVDLSRNYSLREENFYFGALRAYLEMHHNYFEDLEEAVDRFRREHGQLPVGDKDVVAFLRGLLEKQYGYEIVQNGLSEYPELEDLRAVYLPRHRRLLLHAGLSEVQRAFQYGKELGFQYLGISSRAQTSSLLRVHSFEEVLNHFKASYFSAALLIDRKAFVQDLRHFLEQDHWDEGMMRHWFVKYTASPETIIQRMSNLLPSEFGIRKFFVWRFIHTPDSGAVAMDRELNLVRDRLPSRHTAQEHFCRRWSAVRLLHVVNGQHKPLALAQRARIHDTDDTYLCFTMARPALPEVDHKVSITLGLLIDETLGEKVQFLQDPALEDQVVNHTCERCGITDCQERVAPPTLLKAREKNHRIKETLKRLNDAGAMSA